MMWDLTVIRAFTQYALIALFTAYAFWRGAGPERIAGAIMSGMVIVDVLYHLIFPKGGIYDEVDLGHLFNDTWVLIAFALLAIRANRIYPIWMLAAQLIAMTSHLNREVSLEIAEIVYAIMIRVPSYIQLIAFGIGLVAHRRRVLRYGTYRSWRAS